ncbi:hypothetical protein GGX14DRAFT_390968 [Mycena pura]|uniref:Uncharacterized protein n=1 Tax=Mycena pura TaxID=153505 RepID=A0AAD6VM19_9AGAR|nr:hypothetical protein GGX14DRAFT_390968 [Mycena pura]
MLDIRLERLDSDLLFPSSEAGSDYEQLPSQYKEMKRTRDRRLARAVAAMENAQADADGPVDNNSDGDSSDSDGDLEGLKAQELPGDTCKRCIKAEVERDQAQRERDEAQHELAKFLLSHEQTFSAFHRTSAVMADLLQDIKGVIALVNDDNISVDDEEAEEEGGSCRLEEESVVMIDSSK